LLLAALTACSDEPTRPTVHASSAAPEANLTADAPLSFRQVSTGIQHSCGVTTANVAYCWGWNSFGELGVGTNTGPERCGSNQPCSTRPVRVASRLAFRLVSAGWGYTCGVITTGAAYCWGVNQAGNLGIGRADFDPHPRPLPVVSP
jgi:alpha-tubulin suppressor-like RCC1 family protein